MNALDECGGDSVFETPKKKRKMSYVSKRAKNKITAVQMPERERSTYPDCKQTRQVHLLATSTNSLWLAVEDVEWLVLWLADEHRSGGVALTEDHDESSAGNCSVPNVHIRYCFDGTWQAVIIAGPRNGEKVKSHVRNLTEEKWKQVISRSPRVRSCVQRCILQSMVL